MMVRTQIQLPISDHKEIKRKSQALGISMAEYLRRLVRQDATETRPARSIDLTAIFPLGKSQKSNIRHDKAEALVEALLDDMHK